MVSLQPFSALKKKSVLEEGVWMGERASSGAITSGCFLMLAGICFLPAALGPHPDPAILGAGVCLFALGSLVSAGGLYLKARVLQAGCTAGPAKPQKRVRGGCDLCGTDSPVVNCRVHQLHLCGNCVGEHYDFRSCVYVPSTRRPAPAKSPAKAPARFAAKA